MELDDGVLERLGCAQPIEGTAAERPAEPGVEHGGAIEEHLAVAAVVQAHARAQAMVTTTRDRGQLFERAW